MIIAKMLFVTILVLIGLYFLKNSGAKVSAYKRILAVIIVVIGIFFTFNPDKADKIARFVGISRGADLLFYLGLFVLVYSLISEYLFKKKYTVERSKIIRQVSLLEKEIEELRKKITKS